MPLSDRHLIGSHTRQNHIHIVTVARRVSLQNQQINLAKHFGIFLPNRLIEYIERVSGVAMCKLNVRFRLVWFSIFGVAPLSTQTDSASQFSSINH